MDVMMMVVVVCMMILQPCGPSGRSRPRHKKNLLLRPAVLAVPLKASSTHAGLCNIIALVRNLRATCAKLIHLVLKQAAPYW